MRNLIRTTHPNPLFWVFCTTEATQLVVGRRNGHLAVYTVVAEQAILIFATVLSSTIVGLLYGFLSNPLGSELVAVLADGKIIGLRTENNQLSYAMRLKEMQTEIDQLTATLRFVGRTLPKK